MRPPSLMRGELLLLEGTFSPDQIRIAFGEVVVFWAVLSA